MAVDTGLPASGELVMDDLLPMTVEQRAEWFGGLMYAAQVCRHSGRSVMALGLQDVAMERFSYDPKKVRSENPLRRGMPEDEQGMCPFP
jgi:hypothetical protein